MILGFRAALHIGDEHQSKQVLQHDLSVLNAHMLALLVHNSNREMGYDLLGALNSSVSG